MKKYISNVWVVRISLLALLIVLVIFVLHLVNEIDRKEIALHETIEPVCEWPCTAEDRMTAGAWFATLDAENTLEAQNTALTETPVP